MPNRASTHDVYMNIGGTKYGFMLANGKNGKQWESYDSPVLAAQFATSADYGGYPPEREVVVSQNDYRGGFGALFYDKSESRYRQPSGIDTRWRDKLILGPYYQVTLLTDNANLAGTAIGFAELPVSGVDTFFCQCSQFLYSWNTTANIWGSPVNMKANTATDVKSFSGKLYVAMNSASQYKWSADGITFRTTEHSNSKAEFLSVLGTQLAKAVLPNEVKLSTYPDEPAGSDYTPPTATLVNASGAVDAGTHSYKVSFSSVSGVPESLPTLVSNTINCVANVSQQVNISALPVYEGSGATVIRRLYRTVAANASVGPWNFVANISDNTTTYYTDNIGDTALGAGAPTISTYNQWGTAINIGDTSANITGMVPWNDLVYVGKSDSLWTVNSSGTPSKILDFTPYKNSLNLQKMVIWQDKLYFNIGRNGLYCWDGSTLEYIGWDLLAPHNPQKYDRIGAIVGSKDFLYVIFNAQNSSGTSLVATLRKEVVNGNAEWRWHGLQSIISFDKPGCAWLSSLQSATNPYLWIGGSHSATSGNAPRNIVLPAFGVTPDLDGNYQFVSGNFRTCEYDMGFRLDRKIFNSLEILCSIPAGNTLTVSYYLDGSSTPVVLSAIANTEAPVANRFINATGRYISFLLGMTTNSVLTTPIINGIALRGVLRAKKRKVYEFGIKLAEGMKLNSGIDEKQPIATLLTQLNNADDPATQTGVVVLTDRDGTDHNVVIEALRDKEVLDEKDKTIQRVMYVRAVEVRVA